MRRAPRIDANHSAIKQALEAAGATVLNLAGLANGAPDALVGWRGRNILMEFKDGSKPPSKRALTPDQVRFHGNWRGDKVHVVETIAGALALLK